MPTKRIFFLTASMIVLAHPVLGLVRLWGVKTLGTAREGSLLYHAAEIAVVIS